MNTSPFPKTRIPVFGAALLLLALMAWACLPVPKPLVSTPPHSDPTVPRYTRVGTNLPAFGASGGQIPDAQIYNFLSDKCLQPLNESTVQGAAIVQQPCNTRPAQQWSVVHVGGFVVHYVNQFSGMCLDAGGGAANHTPVQQWTCNKISNENWEPGDAPADTIPPLFARVSGTRNFCLDIPGGQTAAGVPMQIYRCNGSGAQMWWTP